MALVGYVERGETATWQQHIHCVLATKYAHTSANEVFGDIRHQGGALRVCSEAIEKEWE